ncbi:MAG: preprotein translocase subunit YajC [Candidatus Rokubacteria bacterium]|nr:preprotein translocase subunit YajC [Candidatus Rokubacteria bacterium]
MSAAHAAELAFAQSQTGSTGGGSAAVLTQVAFFAAIFAIFYFLLIRPQQKQRREREQLLSSLKKGDRVVTSGGLHGTVLSLSKDGGSDTVVLRVTDQVKLEVDRAAITRVVRGSETDA